MKNKYLENKKHNEYLELQNPSIPNLKIISWKGADSSDVLVFTKRVKQFQSIFSLKPHILKKDVSRSSWYNVGIDEVKLYNEGFECYSFMSVNTLSKNIGNVKFSKLIPLSVYFPKQSILTQFFIN